MKLELRKESVKEVRNANMVPGIVYGKKIDTLVVKVEEKLIKNALNEFGKSKTFKVELDGKTHTVYLKEVQLDAYRGNKIIHFDLQKVSEKDKMITHIPVVALHKDAVEKRKLFVQIVSTTIETEYGVGKGITSFDIDVSNFNAGDAVYVKDLVAKASKDLRILEDPEKMVLIVKEPSIKIERTETAEEATVEESEEGTEETKE